MKHVFHLEEGQGAPLVLLHGFCETSAIWNPIVGHLAAHFKLLRVDLPGFGNSEPLAPPFSIDDVATRLWEWLDELKISNPIIVGHSLGGYVTLAMASQRPGDLKSIGLFHSTALPDTDEKKQNRNKVIDFVSKMGVDPFIDTFVPSLFYNKQHPAIPEVDNLCRKTPKSALLGYTAAMRDRPERASFLEKWTKPMLMIAGEKDSVIPLDSLKNQAKHLKNGHFVVLEDTGHMGMYEQSAQAATSMVEFLGKAL